MSGAVTRIGRKRARTWSSLGNLGRVPNEYEIVTHNMNHTYRNDGGQPLEMGPEVQGNVWLRQHRDEKVFGIKDWNDFRDPDQLTYRKYCQVQDERETYVDELIKNFTVAKKSDAQLSANALQLLGAVWTPQRYLAHGQQMLVAYLQQLAPSSYVGNCCTFQTADTLRRVQRIAYRTKQLDNAHPVRGFGHGERSLWEHDQQWQPIRRAIEVALTEYDFDRALCIYQFALKPVLDNLFLNQFSTVARSLGSDIDALIAENLYEDTRRHQRWSIALARFVTERNPEQRDAMRQILAEHSGVIDQVIAAGAGMLASHSNSATAEAYSLRRERSIFGRSANSDKSLADAIATRVQQEYQIFIKDAGLGTDS